MIRLKALRQARGWSGMELARQSGLSPSTISQVEHRRFVPYESQLSKLAAALDYHGATTELLEDVGSDEQAD